MPKESRNAMRSEWLNMVKQLLGGLHDDDLGAEMGGILL